MPTKTVTTYQCGSLTYTLPRLLFVLFWIVVCSAAIFVGLALPGIMLPVQLKALGVNETTKVFLLSTIAQVLNMTVCPYISVASDWHRGKWGRRIPYIFLSMPPIVLSLVLFGLSEPIGRLAAAWSGVAPVTATVVAIGLAMFLFQFFSMWINSVIWYIFNDIIPVRFFGTSMAAFKIGLTVGPALFQYFLFQYVETHPRALYFGIAMLYALGVALFCLFVREGEYPPLTEEQLAERRKPLAERMLAKFKGMGVFVKESFCDRIYVTRYIYQVVAACAGCAGVFSLYMYQELGLTNDMIGKMNGIAGIIGSVGILIVSLLAAEVVNRWHPMRVETYFYFFTAITLPLNLRWLFGTLPPNVFVWLTIANAVCMLFIVGMLQVSSLPTLMLLFPKSRFGSFCAMQALLRSTSVLLIGIVAGVVFDLLKAHYAALGNEQFAFRYVQPWAVPWQLLVPVIAFINYREWGHYGGQRNYTPPASWEDSGHEPMDALPIKPVSPKTLLRCLPVIDTVFALFTILLPLCAFWQCRWRFDAESALLAHYLVAPSVLLLVADAIWVAVRIRLASRAKRILDNAVANDGLLHPAMALVVLFSSSAQLVAALAGNMYAAGRLGYATNCLVAVCVLLLAVVLLALSCMEHGMPQPEEPQQ